MFSADVKRKRRHHIIQLIFLKKIFLTMQLNKSRKISQKYE